MTLVPIWPKLGRPNINGHRHTFLPFTPARVSVRFVPFTPARVSIPLRFMPPFSILCSSFCHNHELLFLPMSFHFFTPASPKHIPWRSPHRHVPGEPAHGKDLFNLSESIIRLPLLNFEHVGLQIRSSPRQEKRMAITPSGTPP